MRDAALSQVADDALFHYDQAAPLDPAERPLGAREGLRWTHVTLTGGAGRRAPAVYVAPEAAAGPLPAALVQHGAGTSKYARFVTACVDILCHAGFACLALDAIGHGEREDAVAQDDETAWQRLRGAPDFVPGNVIDFRRGLDYLAARPEVDGERLAFIGSSMGAMLGAILCAVDTRPRAVVLRCGGARVESATGTGALDHLSYIGRIAPRPLLMLNNTEDEVFGREAVLRLYDATGQPKELRWFPGGHRDNHELHAAECLQWLLRWLQGQGDMA